jgi:plastocyanin
VGSGGGVKNAVLWFTDLPAEKESKPPKLKLDQQGCVFVPHVVAAPLGATLEVVNSDKALHNVRAQAGETRLFNYAMPIQGHVVPTRLKKDGIFKLSCDVHPWMRGWLLVMTSAHFAVTDENGAYKIEGVPAGKHRLKTWHERLGEREAEVEIKAGQTAAHDVAYNPR